MKVVDKIEETVHPNGHYYVQISFNWIYIAKFIDFSGIVVKTLCTNYNFKIEAVYRAAVIFIKWYQNEQKRDA